MLYFLPSYRGTDSIEWIWISLKGELFDWLTQTEAGEYHSGYLQTREPRKQQLFVARSQNLRKRFQ